jgi:hypothetical protein
MKRTLSKVAAILALIIGALAVVAGGSVLRGWEPGYTMVGWLPIYNFVAGWLAMLVAAPLIWRGSRWALPIALVALSAHAVAMLLTQLVNGDVVAMQSIAAMAVRLMVWAVIVILLWLQVRRNRALAG